MTALFGETANPSPPGPSQDHGLANVPVCARHCISEKARDKAAPRVFRYDDNGRGWRVSFVIMGKHYSRYFADRAHRSRHAALQAAKDHAAHWTALCDEFRLLRRTFVLRAGSRSGQVGIARFTGGRNRGAFWMAYWTCPRTRRKISRRFSVSLHGEEPARLRAIACRQDAVRAMRVRYEYLLAALCFFAEDGVDLRLAGSPVAAGPLEAVG